MSRISQSAKALNVILEIGTSLFSFIRQSPLGAPLAFLAYAILAGAFIGYSEQARLSSERARAARLLEERAVALQYHIEHTLSSAYAVSTMVQLGKGDLGDFDAAAEALRSFYPGIAALQLAPGGVVRHVVPLAGNENAIGHNLMTDPERDKEAFLARDSRKLTLAGPFELKQGGLGAAGRFPVYLPNEKNGERFWGFVVVLLRFPEVLSPARLNQLAESGYRYEIWRQHPDSGKKQVIASSGEAPVDPVERKFTVANATWTFGVAPATGWTNPTALALKAAVMLCMAVVLVAGWRKLIAT